VAVSADQLHFSRSGESPPPQMLAAQYLAIDTKMAPSAVKYRGEVRVATPAGGNWLSITPDTGTFPAELEVDVNPEDLAPGSYVGFLVLSIDDMVHIGSTTVAILLEVSGEPEPESCCAVIRRQARAHTASPGSFQAGQ